MDKLRIKNFRCFKDTGEINLAPITFLVGENSSGKTSFLAGYQYIHKFLSGMPEVSFNTPPFNLGDPEQILCRGAKEILFQVRWTIKKNDSPRRIRKSANEFGKRGATEKDANFGIDTSLATLDGELLVTSLDVAMPSGKLRVTEDRTGKKKQVRLSYSPQSKSGKEFLEKINGEKISIHAMMFNIWEVFSPYLERLARGLESDGKKVFTKIEAIAKAQQADKIFEELGQMMRSERWGELFAFSPVRSKPERFYQHGDIVSRSAEGEHISRALYDLFVRESTAKYAKSFVAELANFGLETGLFSEIDIRRLGNQSFDPYQILVVPHENSAAESLVDVGYGVSQILPIVSEILDMRRRGPVTFLIQQPEVHLHPRAQAALTTFFYRIHQKT
ncbi:MAG: AAA family ATPase, partial [Gemmatimonadetes bacterium]|nr:AAA family ATPase [Gemmatimonadota bacterium]